MNSYFAAMPEPYWPKRRGAYTLADAAKSNQYASIRCTYCKRQRYYFVDDLVTAFGDIECDDVVIVGKLRCRNCDGKGSLDFKLGGPPKDMEDVAIQRKIERVVYIRRVVWKDKRGV